MTTIRITKVPNGTIENTGPDGYSFGHAIREALSSPSGINDDAATLLPGELGDVEVEACGGEGAVVGVAVGGFEVTGGVEAAGVPEAAAEVAEERELRP